MSSPVIASASLAQHPRPFPADWASAWGDDRYGLWMELNFRGVTQMFRWIAPGSFMMGSPETEQERDDDEIQHRVNLTQGYWLADTACSQALWLALMRDNPSEFKDDSDNPVENVSWDDAQAFIDKLNAAVPGLHACLPSEAQWEYACRAGTSTPFSFGANITPEQVNYNGLYPYAEGEKGLYRKKTVPVRALPPNVWGLYQMHGNVWEWCQDWYGAYSTDALTDPGGPEQGTSRVLRGGSWFHDGWIARSTSRSGGGPDLRFDFIGFRLALGPPAPAGRAEPALSGSVK